MSMSQKMPLSERQGMLLDSRPWRRQISLSVQQSLEHEPAGDCLGDVTLQSQDIARITLIELSP
jgi:hypothetical protein